MILMSALALILGAERGSRAVDQRAISTSEEECMVQLGNFYRADDREFCEIDGIVHVATKSAPCAASCSDEPRRGLSCASGKRDAPTVAQTPNTSRKDPQPAALRGALEWSRCSQ